MIERVLENWLTNSTERSFQFPVSQILAHEGHAVIHITRHCGLELGKDIITRDDDGVICGYQLKTGKLSLSKWNNEVSHQAHTLVTHSIYHSSIGRVAKHRSILVCNGRIEEEVQRAIEDFNHSLTDMNYLPLETITGTELLSKAITLGNNLVPDELKNFKLLLELYLSDDCGYLNPDLLTKLLQDIYDFENDNQIPVAQHVRNISVASLITSLSTSHYLKKDNYFPTIEAWVINVAYIMAYIEKYSLSYDTFNAYINISLAFIDNSIVNMITELKKREHFVEGDPWSDIFVYRYRITIILGLLSYYRISRKLDGDDTVFIDDFIRDNLKYVDVWGENAIPWILAIFWYLQSIGKQDYSYILLNRFINVIDILLEADDINFPINTYYRLEDLLPEWVDLLINKISHTTEKVNLSAFSESSNNQTHTIESMIHLLARYNRRQMITGLWPSISKKLFRNFEYSNTWQFYLWRTDMGKEVVTVPNRTQSWHNLRKSVQESSGQKLPDGLKIRPYFALLFLCIFPHRISPEFVRWLDAKL